jgi:hypothetical protein
MSMKFSIEIGQEEKHRVEFSWSKWLGVGKIRVDGKLILKTKPLALGELAKLAELRTTVGTARYLGEMMSGKAGPVMIRGWTFEVGDREKHVVRIEKERPKLLAALRPHLYRVIVDGELLDRFVG